MTRLVTITDRTASGRDERDFNARFNRFCSNLKRAGLRWDHYIATLAICPSSGRLHRHVVAIGGPFLHRSVLREHAARAGLGHVDVRRVGTTAADRTRVAEYMARNAVGFAITRAASGARIQPFSRSH